MRKLREIGLILFFILGISVLSRIYALPSGGKFPPHFEKREGFWYDVWGINRNLHSGEDGFLPNMFYETIGNYSDLAYSWGFEFKQLYTDREDRARMILRFVQQWTIYGYDEENVFMDGDAQLEWAWNGDEMAHMVKHAMETMGVVRADCEDVAFFCATLYYGAGFDVAIVDAPSHCALLIWFPDYPNANIYWKIHDGRGYGWIWVEATGQRNQVGWTPPSFNDGDFTAYPIIWSIENVFIIEDIFYTPIEPSPKDVVKVNANVKVSTSQILDVTLIYSVNEGNEQKVNMAPKDASLYEGWIPEQNRDSEVEFYIQIFGVKGEIVNSSIFIYEVKETFFGVEPYLFYLVVGIVSMIILIFIFQGLKRAY